MRLNIRRWGVFNLVGLGGFLLQIGTIALLTRGYGWSSLAATAAGLELAALHAGFPPEIGNTAAVFICAVPNYLVSEHFVFHQT